MSEPRLAAGYRNLLALLRVLGRNTPGRERLDELRAATSRWIAQCRLPVEPDVRMIDATAPGRSGWRVFIPRDAANAPHLFYFHGGGLVFHSLDDFGTLLAHLAASSGHVVTAFAYPTAPETALDDIVDVLAGGLERRLAEVSRQTPLVAAGDSIGAYLALYLALRRHPRRFGRLVLLYPVLDVERQRPSYAAYGTGYALGAEMMEWFQSLCRSSRLSSGFDPFCLSAAEREILPPVSLFSAEFDVLRDEAFDWAAYLRRHRADVAHHHFRDLCHDFCLHAGVVQEARSAVQVIARHLTATSQGPPQARKLQCNCPDSMGNREPQGLQ